MNQLPISTGEFFAGLLNHRLHLGPPIDFVGKAGKAGEIMMAIQSAGLEISAASGAPKEFPHPKDVPRS